MNIFITGGAGFLGSRVVRRAVALGHRVTGLARDDQSERMLQEMGAESVRGALDNISVWGEALRGCDVVVHCAAPVVFWGPRDLFYRDITLATQDLLAFADKMGVRRFIHISTESVVHGVQPVVGIDETYECPEPNTYYGQAKQLAERAIIDFPGSIETIILRPAWVWGLGMAGLKTIVARVQNGQFMWINHGKALIEVVHVDNMAEAIMLACTKGVTKNVYFITDQSPVTAHDFLTEIAETQKITLPTKSVPSEVAHALGVVLQGVWRLLGINTPPPIFVFEWYFLGVSRQYRFEKSVRELGYRPIRTRADGLRDMRKA